MRGGENSFFSLIGMTGRMEIKEELFLGKEPSDDNRGFAEKIFGVVLNFTERGTL